MTLHIFIRDIVSYLERTLSRSSR